MSKDKYVSLSNKEIRAYARERLLGNLTAPIISTLLFFFAAYIFRLCREIGIIGGSVPSFIFYIILSLVVSTIWGIFDYGLRFFYISLVTKKEAKVSNLFAGFKGSTETILAASLSLTLLNLICLSPFYIYGFFFAPDTIQGLIITLCAYVVCSVLYYLVSIIFAPMYFLICDHPGMPFPVVLILNFSMMSFKKWFKYLGLQLSFLPLYLLCFISFGIGFLWVIPYVYTSYTYFYEDLCEEYIFDKDSENTEEKAEEPA